jgi:vancomycin resistance protein VanJ
VQALLWATRRLLIGATLIYCTSMIVLALLWAAAGQQTWWLALSNIFAALLFAPLLLLIPAAIAVRSRWMRVPVGLALAIFVGLFGAWFLPPVARPSDGTQLRVATFNLLFQNTRVDDIIAAIRAQDADVVALQELTPRVAAAVRQELRDTYPHQYLEPGMGDAGMGMISRYPLRLADQQGFSGQRAMLELNGQHVNLVNVHLSSPFVRTRRYRKLWSIRLITDYNTSERAGELPALLRTVDQIEGPLIVLGDFNTGDREPPYVQLAARMQDAYRATAWGFGFTFPNDKRMRSVRVPFPLVRLDYIWSTGGVVPAAARVDCNSGGSDHCIVVADLQVGSSTNLATYR